MSKYRRLYERILAENVLPESNLLLADAASDEQILRDFGAGYSVFNDSAIEPEIVIYQSGADPFIGVR